MTYSKQTWANGSGGGTPLSAARMQHIEDGIQAVETGLVAAKLPVNNPTATGLLSTPALKITGGSPAATKFAKSDADGDVVWTNIVATDITNSTSVGRSVLSAVDAAAARTAIGAAQNLTLSPVVANRQTLPATEAYLAGIEIPAALLAVGSHFRMTLTFSNPATASTSTLRVKYGTAGTTADDTIHTATYTGTAAADVAKVVIEVHIDSIDGSTGQITAHTAMDHNLATTGFANVANAMAATQTGSLNTTGARTLGVSVQETAATTVLLSAVIEHLK